MESNPYAKYLDGAEPWGVLKRTGEMLRFLTAAVSEDEIQAASSPGKWSIREIVVHLADCEIAFAFRLRQILSLPYPELQPFNQESWAVRYACYDFASALALFGSLRQWNLSLLATISASDRDRQATHPERGTVTFWTLVETAAGHDINHLEQIQRLLPKPPDREAS